MTSDIELVRSILLGSGNKVLRLGILFAIVLLVLVDTLGVGGGVCKELTKVKTE